MVLISLTIYKHDTTGDVFAGLTAMHILVHFRKKITRDWATVNKKSYTINNRKVCLSFSLFYFFYTDAVHKFYLKWKITHIQMLQWRKMCVHISLILTSGEAERKPLSNELYTIKFVCFLGWKNLENAVFLNSLSFKIEYYSISIKKQ